MIPNIIIYIITSIAVSLFYIHTKYGRRLFKVAFNQHAVDEKDGDNAYAAAGATIMLAWPIITSVLIILCIFNIILKPLFIWIFKPRKKK